MEGRVVLNVGVQTKRDGGAGEEVGCWISIIGSGGMGGGGFVVINKKRVCNHGNS